MREPAASDRARSCAAMTVTYSPRELLVFSHLKGTVLPEVWRMCAFTCALAYALCHIYNPIRRTVRDGGPKTILYYIFHDCDAFFGLCTSFVTFILSFFNATIFGRWWKMRELCGTVNGRTVDTCVLLSAYIKDQEKLDEMLRLLWLAHALHVHSVIPSSHAGLLAQLVEGGLLMPEELAALQQCSSLASSTPISIAYGWFSSRFGEALLALPPSLHSGLLQSVQTNVSAMRASAADVLMYLATPVPLAYSLYPTPYPYPYPSTPLPFTTHPPPHHPPLTSHHSPFTLSRCPSPTPTCSR